jgi:4-alpha-glucanotransferase
VQLGYTAQDGRRVRASTDTLIAILGALGHPLSSPREIDAALAAGRHARRSRPLEPVVVQTEHGTLSSSLTIPTRTDTGRCTMTVTREDGAVDQRSLDQVTTAGVRHDVDDDLVPLAIDLGALGLPPGYHRLDIDGLGAPATALLLVPPARPAPRAPGFGIFAPLYALRGNSDWGTGNFSDLAALADAVGGWGGELTGTLPLFAAFFRNPVDPSPYLPVSRMFWNELFIDIDAVPELATNHEARDLVGTTSFQTDLERLRGLPMVDYGAVMAAKRSVLQRCADALCGQPTDRRDQFDAFVKSHPELERYADFRAADEHLGQPWQQWPSVAGSLPDIEAGDSASRYHRYVQFIAAEQIAAAADRSVVGRAGIYLDLPVGVHPDGYDTWSLSHLFAPAGVGAPPDDFFSGGQSWGFPPLHPERLRLDGYKYVIDSFRHVLQHARAIRIDHILGFQRMFWIPRGCGADSGAYVRYRNEELRAIVALEASRADAIVVGEDLGTVTPSLRQAMDRDGMLHSFVYQFDADADVPLPQPRKPSMASLGSHDLPRFAAFWRGVDIDDRLDRDLIDPATAVEEHAEREQLVGAVLDVAGVDSPDVADRRTDDSVRTGLQTCLGALAEGPAAYLLVDLADLELEMNQDNRPGTGPEADNWRWRLTRPLAAITADRLNADLLSDVNLRRSAGGAKGAGA